MPTTSINQSDQEKSALYEVLIPFLKWMPLLCAAFVVIYRPIVSGLPSQVGSLSVFILILLLATVCWLCKGVLENDRGWEIGLGTWVACAFLAWMAVSAINGHNVFAGAKVWFLYASYGLTALLVVQLTLKTDNWNFLLSCGLATGLVLAAYGLFHRVLYIPSMQRWLEQDPEYFRSVFDLRNGLLADLESRVGSGRAYGNFVTPNQLASYLLLVCFPIAGILGGMWLQQKNRRYGTRRLWLMGMAFMLVIITLYFTGSKGGLVGFGCGLVVFGFVGWGRQISRYAGRIVAGVVLIGFLFLLAQWLDLAPGWERFGKSMSVRSGYWQASSEMIQDHPVMGVGPGCWAEHYTLRKAPRYGETRLAHNAYLQIGSETGVIGLALFLFILIFHAGNIWQNGITSQNNPPGATRDVSFLTRWGLALATGAFLFDYLFVGSFHPPDSGVPQVLEANPWILYVGLMLLWGASFGLFRKTLDKNILGKFVGGGLIAGVAAFLVHSSAEFTLRIPAIGGTVVVVGALLVSRYAVQKEKTTYRATRSGLAVFVVLAFIITLGWANLVLPRTLDYGLAMDRIFEMRGEIKEGRSGISQREKMIDYYVQATDNIPFSGEAWAGLAEQQHQLWRVTREQNKPDDDENRLESALKAARQAITWNRLKAEYYRIAGSILIEQEKLNQAIPLLRQSAELHPTVPYSWLAFARTAEKAEGLSERVCRAYQRAQDQNIRRVGDSGHVVEGQYHKRNLLSDSQEAYVTEKLDECSKTVK